MSDKERIEPNFKRLQVVIAGASLLLSASAVLPDVIAYFRGPIVGFYPSNQVTFLKAKIGDYHYVRLSATMGYTNSSRYTAVIKREEITMEYRLKSEPPAKSYKQKWQTFETFGLDGRKLISIAQKPANPLPVDGRSAVSHDTYFVPFQAPCDIEDKDEDKKCEWRNYLLWDDFVEHMKKTDEVKIKMTGKFVALDDVSASCMIEVNDYMRSQLNEYEWYSPVCQEIREG